MIFVIGSGPSGVAAASALLARGCRVTMLDVGLTLPEEYLKGELRHKIDIKNPVKLSHGSDYSYAEVNEHVRVESHPGVSCMPSFAQGGLSNVWGAYSEFYGDEDLKGWPIDYASLRPQYQIIKTMINGALSEEDASEDAPHVYRSSRQAKMLRRRWEKNQGNLQKGGLRFGSPMLATKFGTLGNSFCEYCRRCQSGCPDDLVYSSRHTLAELRQNRSFQYVDGVVVDSLHDTVDGVMIRAYRRGTRENVAYDAKQVFVACGPVISTKFLLEADKAIDHELNFIDSTHFLLPSVMFKRVRNVPEDSLHTLAQLYLKLDAPEMTKHQINIQLYTFLPEYVANVAMMLGPMYPLVRPFLGPVIDRLLAVQGHLHHEDSHGFTMKVAADRTVKFDKRNNPRADQIVYDTARKLAAHSRDLGLMPIMPMLSISKVGRSFHYGGSLPMRQNPQPFETDILGRPHGHQRWHIVDSTIFPSIPAGSITPTLMANARRIASECAIHE